MTRRIVSRVVTCAAVLLVPAVVLAQKQAGARTPWGDPDLEGIWTNATITPLERPRELAAKEFYTPEEAAAFEKQRIIIDRNAFKCLQVGLRWRAHPVVEARYQDALVGTLQRG